MGSQTDLDQGGTYRQFQQRWLGPSVGWITVPVENVVAITAAGTTTIVTGVTLVTVNVNGAVTVQLPSSLASLTATAGALPGKSVGIPITIVDIGGYAATHNITILPYGSELIMGLASIQLTSMYGSFQLLPLLNSPGGWSQAAP